MKGINASHQIKYSDEHDTQDDQSEYSDTVSQNDTSSQSDTTSQSNTVSMTDQPEDLSEWYAFGYLLGYGVIVACRIYFFK
jgi:hypothetical protein